MEVFVKVKERNTNPLTATNNRHGCNGLDADALNVFHWEVFILVGVIYRHNDVRLQRFYAVGYFFVGIANRGHKLPRHAVTRCPLPAMFMRPILNKRGIVRTQRQAHQFQQLLQHFHLRVRFVDDLRRLTEQLHLAQPRLRRFKLARIR